LATKNLHKTAREVSTRIAEVSGEAARSGGEAERVHGLASDVIGALSLLRRNIVGAVAAVKAA
jgi:hypothetical protein